MAGFSLRIPEGSTGTSTFALDSRARAVTCFSPRSISVSSWGVRPSLSRALAPAPSRIRGRQQDFVEDDASTPQQTKPDAGPISSSPLDGIEDVILRPSEEREDGTPSPALAPPDSSFMPDVTTKYPNLFGDIDRAVQRGGDTPMLTSAGSVTSATAPTPAQILEPAPDATMRAGVAPAEGAVSPAPPKPSAASASTATVHSDDITGGSFGGWAEDSATPKGLGADSAPVQYTSLAEAEVAQSVLVEGPGGVSGESSTEEVGWMGTGEEERTGAGSEDPLGAYKKERLKQVNTDVVREAASARAAVSDQPSLGIFGTRPWGGDAGGIGEGLASEEGGGAGGDASVGWAEGFDGTEL